MTLSIFDAARDAPARVALVTDDVTLTFAQLSARVERRLGELGAAGVLDPQGERPVAVVARPTLAVVETLFALAAAGTPALLLHARLTDPEREALMRHAGAVAEPSSPPPNDPPTPAQTPARGAELAPFDAERIVALLPTSGSTGDPRIVRLSHRAFLAAGRLTADRLGIEDDRSLLALPLAHIGGLGMLFRCLMHRTTLVLFEARRSMLAELDRLIAAVVERNVSIVSLVPTLLARLLDPPLAWKPPPSLRLVLLGGAPTPRELVGRARAAGVPVVPTYGMTETCASAVLGRYADRLSPPPPLGGEILASGTPGLGVEQRLADGLLELRGDTLFSGYLGGSEHPRGAWLATNDRGFFDASGDLVVTGRATDLIITGGENVDPAEVEAALTALPGVALACVFGMPDPIFGEVVTALVVLKDGAARSPSALAAALGGHLAPYKRPRRIELVAALPLTAAGKIDRRAARDLAP